MLLPRSLFLLPAAVAALALGACSADVDSGPQTSQDRTVGSFTRVETHGAIDVRLRAGEPRSLRVRAGRDAIDDIRTEVRDGTLRIGIDGGSHRGRMVVDVGVPAVDAIEADGAGDIAAGGLHGQMLAVRTDGASDVTANGDVERLVLDVSGAGDLHLGALEARDVRVRMSGSGDAEIRAATRLDADVSGASDLHYHGDPTVSRHVSGAADISRAD
jgi:hypothetical protein